MILNTLKQINLNQKIERCLKEKNHNFSIHSKEKITKILLLVDNQFDNKIEEEIKNKFKIDGVQKIVFSEKLNKNQVNDIFSKKDFTIFANIKNKTLKNLLNEQYDLLINYSVNNLYLKYISVYSNIMFKVGFSSCDKRIYNLMIDTEPQNTLVFKNELEKYLKILKKIK